MDNVPLLVGGFVVERSELDAAFCRASGELREGHQVTSFPAVAFVLEHLSDPLTVDDIVDALPLGRRTLERRVRAELSVTVRRMITLIRLEVARQMLVRTSLPVSDIVATVGFSSSSAMCNVFRRELGRSPRQFREAADDS